MRKWEYKTVRTADYPTEENFRSLGMEGWELVTVIALYKKEPFSYIAYFKRPAS